MANNNGDMFSSLPESLLLTITSLLPFKEAARTSILSTRWRTIWFSTNNIEFNQSFFVTQHEHFSKEIQRRVFIDFTKQWIQRYLGEPYIESFRLVFANPQNYLMDIQHLVSFALEHQVKNLYLDFSDTSWRGIDLDNQAASCGLILVIHGHDRLHSFKLYSCNVQFSESLVFHALKSLSFGWINATKTLIKSLLLKCPVLQILNLEKCWNLRDLEIVVPNLRTLVINKCVTLEKGIKIDAPNLRVFKYSGPVVKKFKIHTLNSLVEAVLDFGLEYDESRGTRNTLNRLLTQICCVRVLTVCSYMIKVISTARGIQMLEPQLNGVHHLTLNTKLQQTELFGVSLLLNICPNLEILSIQLSCRPQISEEAALLKLDDSSFTLASQCECIRKTLKVVEVNDFRGGANEVLVLGYLLRHGMVLEMLSICVAKEEGSHLEHVYSLSAQMLLHLERASDRLHILIS